MSCRPTHPLSSSHPIHRLERLEAILRAIAQGGGGVDSDAAADSVAAVAQLRQQLQEMQQGQVRCAQAEGSRLSAPCLLCSLPPHPLPSSPLTHKCRSLPACPLSFLPAPVPQATVGLQLKYTSSTSQVAQLQPQLEEQQRALARWEAALGRQLEAIVGMQKGALARSSAGSGSAIGRSSGGGSSISGLHTPQSSGVSFRTPGSGNGGGSF